MKEHLPLEILVESYSGLLGNNYPRFRWKLLQTTETDTPPDIRASGIEDTRRKAIRAAKKAAKQYRQIQKIRATPEYRQTI